MTELVVASRPTEAGGTGTSRTAHARSALLAPFTRRLAQLGSVPRWLTWAGVMTSALGLVLIAVAWGRAAALTTVALQVPYVVSAGFTGMALVIVGLAMVSVDAKRADTVERRHQLRELREVLVELRQALEDRP